MMEEGERKEKVGLQRRKQSGRGTLQRHFSVGLRAKHSREGISISWGPTVCRALCSCSSCRDDFYTLPEAAIVSFFLPSLGSRAGKGSNANFTASWLCDLGQLSLPL